MHIRVRLPLHLAAFARAEGGVVALVTAFLLFVLVGLLALGVDVSRLYTERRALQARADVAAVSGVLRLSAARANVDATVAANAGSDDTVLQADLGQYRRDRTQVPSARFTAPVAVSAANGVRVRLSHSVELGFGQVVSGRTEVVLTATATAARQDLAAFSLGSRLASVNGGALNALLGAAFGSSLSLTVLDYNALAGANVDLLTFLDALAVRANLTAADYDTLLNGSVRMTHVAGALADALGTGAPAAKTKLLQLAALAGTTTLPLSRLVEVGDGAVNTTVEDLLPMVRVSALDVLRASADVVNANRIIDIPALAVTVPGVLSVAAKVAAGERRQSSGWIMVGETGATLHTAQVRVWLNVQLSPTLLQGQLGAGVTALAVHVPLYVEVAAATATLTHAVCPAAAGGGPVARFQTGRDALTGTVAGPRLLTIDLGTFAANVFQNTSVALHSLPLDWADALDLALSVKVLLVTFKLDLLTIQLRGRAAIGVSNAPETTFTAALPATQTIGSHGIVATAVAALLAPGTLEIRAKADTLLGVVAAPLLTLVSQVLSLLHTALPLQLTTPLSATVDAALGALGLSVGEADLTLHGVRCGVALVQ